MNDFFDIENLSKKCVRTYVRRYFGTDGNKSRQILSEGCYAMEIINYSLVEGLGLEFNGEKLFLERAIDLDPSVPGRAYIFDKLVLPGHPALVRSDEITFVPNTLEGYSFAVIRHSVVDYKEGIVYPPQKS